MNDFVSEPITPLPGGFDTAAMGRAQPGLPRGFRWRGACVEIARLLAAWKASMREGGRGERYLRRHYYRLRMSDGSVWVVYFLRQPARGGDAKARWFLYLIEHEPAAAKLPQCEGV